jgi:hypothetical protein
MKKRIVYLGITVLLIVVGLFSVFVSSDGELARFSRNQLYDTCRIRNFEILDNQDVILVDDQLWPYDKKVYMLIPLAMRYKEGTLDKKILTKYSNSFSDIDSFSIDLKQLFGSLIDNSIQENSFDAAFDEAWAGVESENEIQEDGLDTINSNIELKNNLYEQFYLPLYGQIIKELKKSYSDELIDNFLVVSIS